MSSYTPPIFTAILFILWQRSRSIPLLCIPLGGPGWTRTNDVSKVTGLQPATLAARLLTHIMPCQIYIQPQF